MWSLAEVNRLIGTPWKPSGEVVDDRIPEVPRAVEVQPEEPVLGPKARNMKILPKHLEKAGYTRGCPKCLDL